MYDEPDRGHGSIMLTAQFQSMICFLAFQKLCLKNPEKNPLKTDDKSTPEIENGVERTKCERKRFVKSMVIHR